MPLPPAQRVNGTFTGVQLAPPSIVYAAPIPWAAVGASALARDIVFEIADSLSHDDLEGAQDTCGVLADLIEASAGEGRG